MVQGADEQAGAEQKQQPQSNLHRHRTAEKPQLSAARSCALQFECLYQIGTPELQRGSQAKQQSNCQRYPKVECQHAPVGSRGEGNLAGGVGPQLSQQQLRDLGSNGNSDKSATQSEHDTL